MKKIISLLFLIITIISSSITVFADEVISVKIPVFTTSECEVVLKNEAGDVVEKRVINGSDAFELNFSSIGIYKYSVYQEIKDNKDVVYDDTVYDVQIIVSYEDKSLAYAIVINENKELEKTDEVYFNNRLIDIEPPELEVEKEVNKKAVKDNEVVEYLITAYAKKSNVYSAIVSDTADKGITIDKSSVKTNYESAEVAVSGQTLTVMVNVLDVNKPLVITYNAKIEKQKNKDKYNNVVTLDGKDETGKKLPPDDDDEDITLEEEPPTPTPTETPAPTPEVTPTPKITPTPKVTPTPIPTVPVKPNTPTNTTTTTRVKTGDNNHIFMVLWVSLICVSSAALVVLRKKSKKK